jgi:hypothetical protein
MSCRRLNELSIVVHERDLQPSDADWESYVGWCKPLLDRYELLKVLVVAGKRSPTAKQRDLYTGEIPGERVRAAVLIDDPHGLVIVKSFAWFVRNIEAFDQDELPAALRYLGVSSDPAVARTIAEFRGTGTSARTSA